MKIEFAGRICLPVILYLGKERSTLHSLLKYMCFFVEKDVKRLYKEKNRK